MALDDQPIQAFLDVVASERVAPSAGAVAAVIGASGAALCEMGCLHTIGKDAYEEVEPELADAAAALRTHRADLLELAAADAEAVDEMQDAHRRSPSEGRSAAMDAAKSRAIEVPLAIAETCLAVLEQAAVVTAKANENAMPDAGAGALFAHAALRAAVWIVQINSSGEDHPVSARGDRPDAIASAAADRYARIAEHLDATCQSTP